MQNKPKLTTYVSTHEQLKVALQNDVDNLILEDSKVSIRSFYDDFTNKHFDKLPILASLARQTKKKCMLIANCDLLFHHRHEKTLLTFIDSVKKAKIATIRVQDPGLILFFKTHYPECSIELAFEIGNQNYKSIMYYSKLCNMQILSNELSEPEIKQIQKEINTLFEIQVQGPILLQYSNRRYLAGLQNLALDEETTIKYLAQDEQYPGRKFIFHDNPHGHFMYLYFHRCLLKRLPQLFKLNLNSWLIDTRGESASYHDAALKFYNHSRQELLKNPNWSAPQEWSKKLEALSNFPQRFGFFKINKTDQIRRKKNNDPHLELVATVLDSDKTSRVTLECEDSLATNQTYILKHPKGISKEIQFNNLYTLSGEAIKSTEPGQLVQAPWQKHFNPKVKLYKSS